MTLLAGTRRLVMAPSSNLPQMTDAAWVFLLPRHARVLVLGNADLARAELASIRADIVTMTPEGPSTMEGPIDALVVDHADAEWVQRAYRDLEPGLGPDSVVVQLPGSASIPGVRSWIMLGGPKPSRTARRLRRIVTLGAARLTTLLRRDIPRGVRQHASDVGFVDIPNDVSAQRDPLQTAVSLPTLHAPDYLSFIGQDHGLSFVPDAWSFGPPRGFASQKVIFGLRTQDGNEVIAKLTQHSTFNARLRAEAEALRSLNRLKLKMATPALLFADEYETLAIVCQTRLTGAPMRAKLDRDPAGAIAQAGFSAIIDLGARTVRQSAPGETLLAMEQLAEDLIDIYRPPGGAREAVRNAASLLGTFELPAVFMHGDLGVWNMLCVNDDIVGVLDWENADPEGVPMWDMFVYARTLGVFLADASGRRYGPSVFTDQFLRESKSRGSLMSYIDEYRRRVEVPARAVDSLFVMCWAQQAVREAASQVEPAWLQTRGTQLLAAALSIPLGYRE